MGLSYFPVTAVIKHHRWSFTSNMYLRSQNSGIWKPRSGRTGSGPPEAQEEALLCASQLLRFHRKPLPLGVCASPDSCFLLQGLLCNPSSCLLLHCPAFLRTAVISDDSLVNLGMKPCSSWLHCNLIGSTKALHLKNVAFGGRKDSDSGILLGRPGSP